MPITARRPHSPRSERRSAACEPRPVLLVSLDWWRAGDARTGLGVASILPSLKGAGIDAHLVEDAVNRPGFDLRDFTERVVAAAASLGKSAIVGISAFVWNEPEVLSLLRSLRALCRCTIVMGGPQVSFVAAGALEALYPQADIFVRGHGEEAMIAIATGAATSTPGVHVAGSLDAGRRAELDLHSLPSPHLDGTLAIGPLVRWETQRGCPYACSFCQHREAGQRLRNGRFDDQRIITEAAAFAGAGVQRASILDPIFHANRARAVALLRAFRAAGLHAQLSLQCRFELVDADFLDALDSLDVVLEFGLQTIHVSEGKAIRRPNHMDRVEAVIEQLHARGIPFEVSLIYGLPNQTLESFARSVEWCLEHDVPAVRAWPLMLLRGTPLDNERERWGLVESEEERIPIVVASSTFTPADHAEMARIAQNLEQADRRQRAVGAL